MLGMGGSRKGLQGDLRKLLGVRDMFIILTQWWFHVCMDISKFSKVYLVNMCSLLYVNYILIKW